MLSSALHPLWVVCHSALNHTPDFLYRARYTDRQRSVEETLQAKQPSRSLVVTLQRSAIIMFMMMRCVCRSASHLSMASHYIHVTQWARFAVPVLQHYYTTLVVVYKLYTNCQTRVSIARVAQSIEFQGDCYAKSASFICRAVCLPPFWNTKSATGSAQSCGSRKTIAGPRSLFLSAVYSVCLSFVMQRVWPIFVLYRHVLKKERKKSETCVCMKSELISCSSSSD